MSAAETDYIGYAVQIEVNTGSQSAYWDFDDEFGPIRESLDDARSDYDEAVEYGRQAALDLYELARWNAAQRAAVAVNRERPRAEARRDAIVIRDSGL